MKSFARNDLRAFARVVLPIALSACGGVAAATADPEVVAVGALARADGGNDADAATDAHDADVCTKTLYPSVQPVLQANCATADCHAGDGWGEACAAARASAADMADQLSAGTMGASMPPAQRALLLAWIRDGALCGPGCS
jgi:hypothetical protein